MAEITGTDHGSWAGADYKTCLFRNNDLFFELDARPLSIPRFDSEDLSSTTRKKYVTAYTYPRDFVHGAVSDGIFNAGEENLQHTGLIFETGNCIL